MENVVNYVQQYPLVVAVIIIVVLLLVCWKSKKVWECVVRLAFFALVMAALYFAFQKFGQHLSSSQEPMATSVSQTPEEHAGHKYYRDPEKRIQK